MGVKKVLDELLMSVQKWAAKLITVIKRECGVRECFKRAGQDEREKIRKGIRSSEGAKNGFLRSSSIYSNAIRRTKAPFLLGRLFGGFGRRRRQI